MPSIPPLNRRRAGWLTANIVLIAANCALGMTLLRREPGLPRTAAPLRPEAASAPRATAGATAHAVPTPSPTEAASTPAAGRPLAELKAGLESPDEREAMRLFLGKQIEPKYRHLFSALNIAPDVRGTLVALLAERDIAVLERLVGEADSVGSGKDDARDMVDSSFDQKIEALVGPEAYRTFNDYERTLPVRLAVDDFERRLSYTSAPLTPEQYDLMVTVLDDPDRGRSRRRVAAFDRGADLAPGAAAMTRLRAVLSDQQYRLYEKRLRQREIVRAMEQRYPGQIKP